MLALNSWELLLKAKILLDNNNKLNALYKYETRETKSGGQSKKKYIIRNRAGNPQTIGFWKAFASVEDNGSALDKLVKANLEALAEVRNNAVHFVNNDDLLQRMVFELSAANVMNYGSLVELWFGETLDSYNLHLLPLGFLQTRARIGATVISANERNLISFLEAAALSSREREVGVLCNAGCSGEDDQARYSECCGLSTFQGRAQYKGTLDRRGYKGQVSIGLSEDVRQT